MAARAAAPSRSTTSPSPPAACTRRCPLALRDIRLVSEPDAAGRSFGSDVNGRDIFARGANWIPADALPGRITDGEDPRASCNPPPTPT